MASAGCDIALAHAGPASEGRFDRTLAVSGPVELRVETGSGDIEVSAGPSDSVTISGHVRAGRSYFDSSPEDRVAEVRKNPPISQDGNVIRVGNTFGSIQYTNVRISYRIVVPPGTAVRSRSGSGDQLIGDGTARVDARAGSGDIEVGSSSGNVEVSTGSGDIALKQVDGELNARAGSGHIKIDGVKGNVRASAGSGDIEIVQMAAANVTVRTGSGDVSLNVPDPAGFDLEARTGSGSIRLMPPLSLQGEAKKHRMSGRIGDGGVMVSVSTGSGEIRIE